MIRGWRTSEFWLTAATIAGLVARGTVTSCIAAAALCAAYTASRTTVKGRSPSTPGDSHG